MSSAPIRTMGSGSESPVLANPIFEGERREPSSLNALARAIAGALRSEATTARSAAASAWSVHDAWNASA
jgi:hypothetical protein